MNTSSLNYKRFYFVKEYFTKGQNFKIYLLLFFLILFPFIRMYGNFYYVIQVEDPLFIWSVFNFVAIAGCAIAFVFHQKKYSLSLIIISITVIIMLILNFFLAEMAQLKWFLNWVGFLFIFVVISQLIKTMNDSEMYVLQIKFIDVVKVIVFMFTLMTIYALVMDPWYLESRLFNYYVFEDRNQIHRLYTNYIGTHKQHYGIFVVMLFSYVYTHRKFFNNSTKILFFTFFAINLVAIIGVRSVLLGSMVGVMAFYFLKNRQRFIIAILMALSVVMLVYIYRHEWMPIIELLYDRLPGLTFAIDSMVQNIFGLGNGAYAVFVVENNDQLLRQFGSDLMEWHGLFWKAPESDLIYFIASWGILSIVFFGFLGFMVFRGIKLFYHTKSLFPIEKHIIVFTILLIFMGISNDNAGKLTWWIFISSLFGVILRRRRIADDEETFHFKNLEYREQKGQ